MPTYNRRQFVPRAIDYFLKQDYANRELIVVDDGTDPIDDLLPVDERIHYVRLDQKLTTGAKLNLACTHARGEIIARWDDDDWYAPRRLTYQVDALADDGIYICGSNRLLYYNLETGRAYEYQYPQQQRMWLLGSTLCFRKKFWETHRFIEQNVGEDARFVWKADPHRVLPLQDHAFAVHMIHQRNVSPKNVDGSWWHPYPTEAIAEILGADWEFYKHDREPIVVSENREPVLLPVAAPVRNVFACLVHEN